MKQTNTNTNSTPLWMELNERRTPGTLSITATKNHFFLEQPDGNGGADTFCTFSNTHEWQETNAKYTALAVNNLARLAETLEWIENEIKTTPDALADALQGVILIQIKQTLAAIS